jgi:hypothetical protein
MSRKKDLERAMNGNFFRNGVNIHATPGSKLDIKTHPLVVLRCGKCNRVFDENMASEHLKVCQPDGAICSYCHQKFLPHEFVPHIQKCRRKVALIKRPVVAEV